MKIEKKKRKKNYTDIQIAPGFERWTFRVWGERHNHYTTDPASLERVKFHINQGQLTIASRHKKVEKWIGFTEPFYMRNLT